MCKSVLSFVFLCNKKFPIGNFCSNISGPSQKLCLTHNVFFQSTTAYFGLGFCKFTPLLQPEPHIFYGIQIGSVARPTCVNILEVIVASQRWTRSSSILQQNRLLSVHKLIHTMSTALLLPFGWSNAPVYSWLQHIFTELHESVHLFRYSSFSYFWFISKWFVDHSFGFLGKCLRLKASLLILHFSSFWELTLVRWTNRYLTCVSFN